MPGQAVGSSEFYGVFDALTSSAVNNYSVNYSRFFLQPSLNFKPSSNYTISLGTKFSLINYSRPRTDYSRINEEALGYIDTKPSFFIDYVLNNEFGFKGLRGVKFQVQQGLTNLRTTFEPDPNFVYSYKKYYYNSAWFSAGVIADINLLFSKNQVE